MKIKIGFVGAGNIVQAILAGTDKSGAYSHDEIGIYDIAESLQKQMRSQGYCVFDTIENLMQASELTVIAVTPQVIRSLVGHLRGGMTETTLLLSVVAGIRNSWYEKHLGRAVPVVRCMPTLTAQAGLGAFAVTRSQNVTDAGYQKVQTFLNSCGIIEEIPESLMDAVVPINGSAPAYFYHMAAVIAQEAAKWGFDEPTAVRLFAETMKGSAEMLLSSGLSPCELEAKLRLPGGTTLAALDKMTALGFDYSFAEGLNACMQRSQELSHL